MRQNKRADPICFSFKTDKEKSVIVNGMESLGFEKVSGPPLYDNGDFIVIDTIKDLRFVVARVYAEGNIQEYRQVDLDKYEAIRVADEFKEVLHESQGSN